jgi:hypothetical protein
MVVLRHRDLHWVTPNDERERREGIFGWPSVISSDFLHRPVTEGSRSLASCGRVA